MLDHWGNAMQVGGGQKSFAVTVGGPTYPMPPGECAALANRVAPLASAVSVGATATIGTGLAAGRIQGGLAFKSSGSITQGALGAGCSQPGTVVAMEFQ